MTAQLLRGLVVNSWVITCFAKILRSLSDERVIIFKISAAFVVFLNFSLIFFVIYLLILPIVDTRNQSKVNKFLHEPLQTLQRRRKFWKLPLRAYQDNCNSFFRVFFSLLAYRLILLAISRSSGYIANIPSRSLSFFSPNMCNPIIYCFRNKTALRKACTELLKI